jgi:hypothetical protein
MITYNDSIDEEGEIAKNVNVFEMRFLGIYLEK